MNGRPQSRVETLETVARTAQTSVRFPATTISRQSARNWLPNGIVNEMGTLNSRAAGSGCPFCSNRNVLQGYNDLATTHPKIATEWNFERNGELLPEQFTYGSERQVWWRCPKCGHEWKTSINNRTNGAFATGCPKCGSEYGTSFPEQALLFYVRKYIDTDAKSRFKANLAGKTEELDIWIPSLRAGIEYDGEFFHAKRTKKDREKDEAAARANIRLIRIIECRKNDAVNDRIFIDVHKGRKENIERAISHVISTLAKRDIELDIDADTPEIMSLYKKSIEERSLKVENPELAADWNYERNGRLKPENVSYGSTRKVWWKCPKGHEWIAAVNSRTNPKLKSGCPYCSNKKALAGYNDLATVNPKLAAEWDSEKNGDLKPTNVTPGSCKKVWWKCPKCNSSYEASVANRSNGRGCPICCGKKIAVGINDLAAANPSLAAEWDYARNGDLKPTNVTAGSHRKVWWQGACGHEWQASVANRGRGSGCPYCGSRKVLVGYNDLATTNPEVAAEWDYDRNGDLIPENVMPKSGKKVWWKCSRCGNEWLTAVNVRTAGHICPHCAHTINQRR